LSNPIQAHSIAIEKDEKNPSPIEHVLLHSLLLHIHIYAWHFQESGSWSGSLGKIALILEVILKPKPSSNLVFTNQNQQF
jgi:hypothetical protein